MNIEKIIEQINPLRVSERINYEKVKRIYDNNLAEPITMNELLDFIKVVKTTTK